MKSNTDLTYCESVC